MIRLGVLVSGGGTNLQSILDAIDAKALDAVIGVVVSNVAGARALDRARAAEIPAILLEHGRFSDRAAFDAALVDVLRAHSVDVVVLAGFMRLVTPVLLDAFPWRVVNVHPALLPAFPGMRAQKQALDYGVRIAGCTVHLVDHGTDTGPIVAQAAVAVNEDDNEESLRARILACEHQLLPRVLQWLAEGRVSVEVLPNEDQGESRPARTRARVHVRGVRTAMGLDGG
ncbi:MAG: phosphoribosylglycinamide formyltransferase [Myxococcota bacterium]|nr:phosphoribosylglycinamide formyltransferase [Myxococcota bacterium]